MQEIEINKNSDHGSAIPALRELLPGSYPEFWQKPELRNEGKGRYRSHRTCDPLSGGVFLRKLYFQYSLLPYFSMCYNSVSCYDVLRNLPPL